MGVNPLMGLFRTCFLYLSCRVKFVKSSVGKELTMNDNAKFKVFRHVIIKPASKHINAPEAIFIIRFKPKDMSVEENKKFSRIPMIFFMGFTGFRSKLWMVDEETGLCQGIYEWQTLKDAKNYSKSFAVKFMTRRSVPDSVTFKIIRKHKTFVPNL